MADVITTLHPEGVQEDNLYPNIKRENIPDSALYGDLLWENASPYSTFDTQTVSIGDLSDYRILRFYMLISASDSQARQQFDMELRSFGNQTIYLGMFDNTSANYYHRGIVVGVDGTIQFDSGYMNGTTSNSACIPVKIYGIK